MRPGYFLKRTLDKVKSKEGTMKRKKKKKTFVILYRISKMQLISSLNYYISCREILLKIFHLGKVQVNREH